MLRYFKDISKHDCHGRERGTRVVLVSAPLSCVCSFAVRLCYELQQSYVERGGAS